MKETTLKLCRLTTITALLVAAILTTVGMATPSTTGGNDDSVLAHDLTAYFRAYRATITKHPDAIHVSDKFFSKDKLEERIATAQASEDLVQSRDKEGVSGG